MAQVAGLIKRLSEQGKIIFIVTHDFEFVCRTCSRVLHFDEGEMPDDIPVVMDSSQRSGNCSLFQGERRCEVMKQKKKNRIALLLQWAGEQKIWLLLAILLAMASGLCIIVPYIGIYRVMDAVFQHNCTNEFVVQTIMMIAVSVVLRFVLLGVPVWLPIKVLTALCSRYAAW